MRLYDPRRGVLMPTVLEMSRRAEAEAQARAEAEAEVARLRAELAVLRGEKQG